MEKAKEEVFSYCRKCGGDTCHSVVAELYDALKEAGATDGKAQAAAKAIAEHENRFGKIEADLLVLKWMVGAILAGVASLVTKTFLG